MPQNAFLGGQTHDLVVSQKMMQPLFPHPLPPFPSIFCKWSNGCICTASKFEVQLPLLYTAWSNAYSEIGPEVTLWPLVTSCTKDYKGHSLVQNSFTAPPNTVPKQRETTPLLSTMQVTLRQNLIKKKNQLYTAHIKTFIMHIHIPNKITHIKSMCVHMFAEDDSKKIQNTL